jgi:hypothetical protein
MIIFTGQYEQKITAPPIWLLITALCNLCLFNLAEVCVEPCTFPLFSPIVITMDAGRFTRALTEVGKNFEQFQHTDDLSYKLMPR